MREIRDAIEETQADIVLLQEVFGNQHRREMQFEYLADRAWKHYAYGKNAVYPSGHHGNAILSKFPIARWENIDVSTNRLEKRGVLHVRVDVPGELDIFCVHLGLFEAGRDEQLTRLAELIAKVPEESPVLLGGDFNDWRIKASSKLLKKNQLKEVFETLKDRPARTFPAILPALCLDRVYVRGLKPIHCEVMDTAHWSRLSDHAALFCEVEWPGVKDSDRA